jgi:predicted transcriptional regulator
MGGIPRFAMGVSSQLGNRISLALADLEERGHVQRAPVPGRSYTISVSGIEIAKERR